MYELLPVFRFDRRRHMLYGRIVFNISAVKGRWPQAFGRGTGYMSNAPIFCTFSQHTLSLEKPTWPLGS